MFCAVFGMLSLIYLIPATIKEEFAFHPIIMIVLDALNTIFFFCCAVALAAELGVHSCSSLVSGHSPIVPQLRSSSTLAGLYRIERYHGRDKWGPPGEAVPRGAGLRCVPLVWLRCVRRFSSVFCASESWQRQPDS